MIKGYAVRLEEVRSAITLIRCFLHENTQRGKIARVKFAEELGTTSKNRLRWITLVRGPIWRIHSLTLMISWFRVLYPIFVRRFQAIMLYFDDTLDDEDDLMIFDELEVKLTAVNFVRVNTTFPQNFGRQRV